jgi:hypothetical protein
VQSTVWLFCSYTYRRSFPSRCPATFPHNMPFATFCFCSVSLEAFWYSRARYSLYLFRPSFFYQYFVPRCSYLFHLQTQSSRDNSVALEMEYAAFSYSPRSNSRPCAKLNRQPRFFFVDNAIVVTTKNTILALALRLCACCLKTYSF